MPADVSIPYWAAALYGLLGAAGIIAGGFFVGRDTLARRSAKGVWPGVGAGFLIALGVLGALPDACERVGSIWIGGGLALAAFLTVLFAHGAGHREADHVADGAPGAGHSHGHSRENEDRAHDTARAADSREHSHAHASSHPNHAHAHARASTDTSHGHTGAHAGLSLHDARLAVSGLALHALLDGVAVSAALASLQELGLVVAFFVVLHKIPEGAAAAALTYASGGEAKRARSGVLLVAAASFLGGLTIFAVRTVLGYALGVAAGVTAGVGVGIATHLLRHDRKSGAIGLALGAGLFALGELLLHEH
jgi:zinc transporter ZupT